MAECGIENVRDRGFLHFAGLIVNGFAVAIENSNVGDGTLVILLYQRLLGGGLGAVQVHDDELDAAFVFFVERNGAAGLVLGVVATFAIENYIVRLAGGDALFHVIAGDEEPILAVTGIIQMLIEAQIVGGAGNTGKGSSKEDHGCDTTDSDVCVSALERLHTH